LSLISEDIIKNGIFRWQELNGMQLTAYSYCENEKVITALVDSLGKIYIVAIEDKV
jgi:hypothetical protein